MEAASILPVVTSWNAVDDEEKVSGGFCRKSSLGDFVQKVSDTFSSNMTREVPWPESRIATYYEFSSQQRQSGRVSEEDIGFRGDTKCAPSAPPQDGIVHTIDGGPGSVFCLDRRCAATLVGRLYSGSLAVAIAGLVALVVVGRRSLGNRMVVHLSAASTVLSPD